MNTLSDRIWTHVMSTSCGTASPNDWIHNEQVWFSGYKPYWNNQMTPLCMKAPPDMIVVDVMLTLCCIVRQIAGNHSEQVWVLGYKPHGSKQTRDIFMNTLPDIVCIDVVTISCGIGPKMIGSTMKRWGYNPNWNNQMSIYKYPNRHGLQTSLYLWIA